MADVWVLQNSDKSIAGVFGSKKATNGKSEDEDARALPFDIIEPKPGAGVQTIEVEVPVRVEVPVNVEVEVPVYVPSDNADGASLLAALNQITEVLTKAKAPQQILDAIKSIASPAIEAYNSSALPPVEFTPSSETPIFDEAVTGDDALDFLFGESPEVEVPVAQPEPVVIRELDTDPDQDFLSPDSPVPFIAPPVEIPEPNFVEKDAEDESDYDQAPPPVSSFSRPTETGLGDIVSPVTDPHSNPALNEGAASLNSWLVAEQPVAQPQPTTRREALAQEAGEAPQSVVI